MNTRLQVEHPVTEMITGLDLVEDMIMIAAGKDLRHKQSDIGIHGWAMESRLYAEDPYRNFMPAIGRLSLYRPPAEQTHDDGTITRNDTGVGEGDIISIYYDPMIAKLCSWGHDRNAAIGRMQTALDAFTMRGIGHNIPFLSAVMEHDRFISGNITTAFIDDEYQDGFRGVTASPARKRHLGMIMAAASCDEMHRLASLETAPTHPRHDDNSNRQIVQFANADTGAHDADEDLEIDITRADDGSFNITAPPEAETNIHLVMDRDPSHPRLHILLTEDGETNEYLCELWRQQDRWHLYYRGISLCAHVRPPHIAALAHHMKPVERPDTSNMLLCPMPGSLIKLFVAEGEIVEAGQTLCIVEAMKMENALIAEKRCKIEKLLSGEGDILSVDATIMTFAAAD
jgi:propionyl-CoA carboxylase alpha chain